MIRVIFLDCDGVMLPFGADPDDRASWKRAELATLYEGFGHNEPLIVLVSDWRFGMVDQAIDMIDGEGYPTPLPLPNSIRHRDRETLIRIAAGHLRLLDGEWIAIDDCVPDKPPFFRCQCGEGLTQAVIDRVHRYARGEPEPYVWKPHMGDANDDA